MQELCLYLLVVIGLLVMINVIIPPARTCWLPPNANTRHFTEKCWTYSEAGFQ